MRHWNEALIKASPLCRQPWGSVNVHGAAGLLAAGLPLVPAFDMKDSWLQCTFLPSHRHPPWASWLKYYSQPPEKSVQVISAALNWEITLCRIQKVYSFLHWWFCWRWTSFSQQAFPATSRMCVLTLNYFLKDNIFCILTMFYISHAVSVFSFFSLCSLFWIFCNGLSLSFLSCPLIFPSSVNPSKCSSFQVLHCIALFF